MAFNGSGTFNRLYNWVTDRDNSVNIRADKMDAEMDGFATGLSLCINKNGQSTITANIPFNSKKITNLGDATVSTDAMNRQSSDARYLKLGATTAKAFIDTPYTDVGANNDVFIWDTSGGACTHNLAAAATVGAGYVRTIMLETAGNDLTIDASGAETINGAATVVLNTAYDFVVLRCDGTEWRIFASNIDIEISRDLSPQLGGFLDTNGNYIQCEKGGDIASASPLVIDTDGDYFDVTGTTSFAAMTVAADRHFTLQFDGILTITHGASLILPGAANITTAAGDVAVFQSTATNTVQCVSYNKADGTPIVSPSQFSWTHIADEALSGASHDEINLSAYSILRITLENVIPATDNTGFWLRTDSDNGASFDATIGHYQWIVNGARSGNLSNGQSDASDNAIEIVPITFRSIGNASTEGISGEILLFGFNQAAYMQARWDIVGVDTGGAAFVLDGAGTRADATARDAFQLLFSSGNITSGRMILEGRA